MAMDQPDEMSFLQHLEELRWHLIRAISAIIIVAILAFLNKTFVFDVIIFSPKKADFISRLYALRYRKRKIPLD